MMAHRAFAFVLAIPLLAGCAGSVVGGGSGDPPTGTTTSEGTASGTGTEGTGGAGGGEATGGGGAGTGGTGAGGAGTAGSGTGGGGTSCPNPACVPGQTRMDCCGQGYDYTCIPETCVVYDGCPGWNNMCWTPLVISFDGAPVAYRADPTHGFQLATEGETPTDWPTARTPWLALDRNGNGAIDDGSELFGSMTAIGEGRRAGNGFEALLALDADGDGFITERDPAFAELVLWFDRDADRRSGAGELVPVSQAGLVSIDVRYVSAPRCDGRGNCEVERAPVVYRDASGVLQTGAVVDVHLAARR